jgi:DNA-binding MarR family transcriptional regulator
MNALDVHAVNAVGVTSSRAGRARNNRTFPLSNKDMSSQSGVEDPAIVVRLLSAIERNSALTQRRMSQELGIALGLANAYLRRCVRKGLVKMGQVPMRRYAYYLTPKGFAEKSRLTAEYLTVSLDFFRRARRECTALLSYAQTRRWRHVVLFGAGDLAEVAVLSADEARIEILAVVDRARQGERCVGRPVVSDLGSLAGQIDAVMLTAVAEPQMQLDAAVAQMAALGLEPERLLIPELLHLRSTAANGMALNQGGAP